MYAKASAMKMSLHRNVFIQQHYPHSYNPSATSYSTNKQTFVVRLHKSGKYALKEEFSFELLCSLPQNVLGRRRTDAMNLTNAQLCCFKNVFLSKRNDSTEHMKWPLTYLIL